MFALLALVVIGLLFFAAHSSQAADPATGGQPAGGVKKLVYNFIYALLAVIVKIVLALFSWLATGLDLVLSFKLQNLAVVQPMWAIIRNFSNMFFVIVMIIMAFATIFDVGFLAGYDVRSLIGKFLIAALLINFSLTIGQLIIQGSDTVNGFLLSGMSGIADRLGCALDPAIFTGAAEKALKGCTSQISPTSLPSPGPSPSPTAAPKKTIGSVLYTSALMTGCALGVPLTLGALAIPCTVALGAGPLGDLAAEGVGYAVESITGIKLDNIDATMIVRLFFVVILGLIAVFSIGTAFLFALVRIPILMLLLVLSPLAWLASILPFTQNANRRWWHQFIAWNLFLPFFLLILYFGLYFLSQEPLIVASLTNNTAALSDTGAIGVSLQLIIFYIMTGLIFIGGTNLAMQASQFSGTGVVGAAQGARGAILGTFRLGGRATLATGRGVGRVTGATAAFQGAKEGLGYQVGRLRREGVTIGGLTIPGERGAEETRARVAASFGVPGALDKQRASAVEEEKKKVELIRDERELRTRLASGGTREKQLALLERLKELGVITGAESQQAYQLYGGDRSLNARKFVTSIDYGSMSPAEREEFSKTVTDIEARRKLSGVRAEKGEIKEVDELVDASQLYATEGQRLDFFSKAKKKNFANAMKAQVQAGAARAATDIKDAAGTVLVAQGQVITNYFDALGQEVGKMKVEDLVDFSPRVFESETDNLNKELSDPGTSTARKADIQKDLEKVTSARGALVKSLSQKKIAAITERVSGEQLAQWDALFKEASKKPPRGGSGGAGGGGGQGGTPPPRRQAGFTAP